MRTLQVRRAHFHPNPPGPIRVREQKFAAVLFGLLPPQVRLVDLTQQQNEGLVLPAIEQIGPHQLFGFIDVLRLRVSSWCQRDVLAKNQRQIKKMTDI